MQMHSKVMGKLDNMVVNNIKIDWFAVGISSKHNTSEGV